MVHLNIALMSNDGKKELMVHFCIAYCGILAGHTICATQTTGKLIGAFLQLSSSGFQAARSTV